MSKSIQLDTELLERQYQHTLDIIYLRSQYFPRPYPEIDLDETDIADLDYTTAQANAYSDRTASAKRLPHKKVITSSDREYCNGLRRR